MDDLNDEEFSDAELAEAEALARALDGGSHQGGSEAALEAAALLRVAQRPVLDEVRFGELRTEVLQSATLRRAQHSAGRSARGSFWSLPSWVWLRWAGLLVPAALLVFVGVRSWTWGTGSSAQIASDVTLPRPSLALLRSQAQALQGEQTREYEARMAEYRGQVFAALEQRATTGGRF